MQEKPEFLAKVAENLAIKEEVRIKELAVVEATKLREIAQLAKEEAIYQA